MRNLDLNIQQSFEMLRAGNRRGLQHLYELSSGLVFGVVSKVVDDDTVASAVVKSLYLKVWQDRTAINAYKGWTITSLTVLAHRMAVEALYSIDIGDRLASSNHNEKGGKKDD